MSITLESMKSKLLTIDQVREPLAASEPLNEYPLDMGYVKFVLEDGWNHGLEAKRGNDVVDATVYVGTTEIPMTKDAMLQAASLVGITGAYLKRTPAKLIEPHLNYWYDQQGIGNRPAKVLVANGDGVAVTRQSITPFSNLELLDKVVDGIKDETGELPLVDAKFHHSMASTYIRLIIPSRRFVVPGTGVEDDEWFAGINLYNSLTGHGKTSLNGYLFRWWCMNGAIDTKASSGTWTRSKGADDPLEVYDWAREVIPSITESLDHSLEMLTDMASREVEGDLNEVIRDLCKDYGLTAKDKAAIVENMIEEEELTWYSLMQAVTDVANNSALSPEDQMKLMSAGGSLMRDAAHRCETCLRPTLGV